MFIEIVYKRLISLFCEQTHTQTDSHPPSELGLWNVEKERDLPINRMRLLFEVFG